MRRKGMVALAGGGCLAWREDLALAQLRDVGFKRCRMSDVGQLYAARRAYFSCSSLFASVFMALAKIFRGLRSASLAIAPYRYHLNALVNQP